MPSPGCVTRKNVSIVIDVQDQACEQLGAWYRLATNMGMILFWVQFFADGVEFCRAAGFAGRVWKERCEKLAPTIFLCFCNQKDSK